jgi:hypothetical protein
MILDGFVVYLNQSPWDAYPFGFFIFFNSGSLVSAADLVNEENCLRSCMASADSMISTILLQFGAMKLTVQGTLKSLAISFDPDDSLNLR